MMNNWKVFRMKQHSWSQQGLGGSCRFAGVPNNLFANIPIYALNNRLRQSMNVHICFDNAFKVFEGFGELFEKSSPKNYNCSASACQRAEAASDGILQSPRGERATEPTLGPSGKQERLNC